MIKKYSILIILSLCFILPLSCKTKKLPVSTITIVRSNGSKIEVAAEVARKPEERNHGYMERKVIPDGTGMFFIFENDQILSFWMKNTPHPLSIAYIDSEGIIQNIYDMTPFSLSPIISTVSVRYALEVPQGWFKKNNIKTGDTILFQASLIQ